MTMYLWLKLLAFGFVFLDIEVSVTGQVTILPSNGLNITEKALPLLQSDPSPALTTELIPSSISERENDSSETTYLSGVSSTPLPHLSLQTDLQTPSARGADTQTLSIKAEIKTLTPVPASTDPSGVSGDTTTPGTFSTDTDLPADTLTLARNSSAVLPTNTFNISTTDFSSGANHTTTAPSTLDSASTIGDNLTPNHAGIPLPLLGISSLTFWLALLQAAFFVESRVINLMVLEKNGPVQL